MGICKSSHAPSALDQPQPQARRLVSKPEPMSMEERRAVLNSARSMGGKAGAEYAHATLPAVFWGSSKKQVLDFVNDVAQAVKQGDVVNFTPAHLPQYSEDKFSRLGPNMHQTNAQFIKPRTAHTSASIPFVSYALMMNSEVGLKCDLFLSHAWDEGAFEFGRNIAGGWRDELGGAYICFLANPQNLDISSLVSSPKTSPFYKVLEAGPAAMLMLVNENTPIHSRLWCVFEAHCATEMDIPIEFAGNPSYLVDMDQRLKMDESLTKRAKIRRARFLSVERQAKEGTGPSGGPLQRLRIKALGRTKEEQEAREAEMREEDIQTACMEAIWHSSINVCDANCTSPGDKTKILEEIAGREDELNRAITDIMMSASDEQLELATHIALKVRHMEIGRGWNKLRSGIVGESVKREDRRLQHMAFAKFDKNCSGYLELAEIKAMFEDQEVAIPAHLDLPRKALDYKISPSDFEVLLESKFEKGDPLQFIEPVFTAMDSNKDAVLDLDELDNIAKSLGEDLSRAQLTEMIKKFSSHGNSFLTLDDFYTAMQMDP